MIDPKYAEHLINAELEGSDIHVVWNGDEPERDEPIRFYVCYGDEDTDLVLWDHGLDIDIMRHKGGSSYGAVSYARGYAKLAAELVEVIAEEVASGKLGVEE